MGLVDNVKEIAKLVRAYNDVELLQKIVDLQASVFDLEEANLALRRKVKELEDQQIVEGQLVRDESANVYHRVTHDGTRTGPFCMACWDGERKLVNVIVQYNDVRGILTILCGRCEKPQR